MSGQRSVGLTAAFLLAIVPTFVSRSVAGSYHTESAGVFGLLLCLHFFAKWVNGSSLTSCLLACLAHGYTMTCWQGYLFISFFLPLYIFCLIMSG